VKRPAMTILALALAASSGCGGGSGTKTKVSMSKVPGVVLKAAEKELKGVSFDAAFTETVKGQDAFELRGTDPKTGKSRGVQVARDGKVLNVE
jgi:hypothetical protein